MAAIAYPVTTPRWRGPAGQGPASRPHGAWPVGGADLRLVDLDSVDTGARTRPAGTRVTARRSGSARVRLLPGLLSLAVLLAIWFGADAMAAARPTHLVRPVGAQLVHGGFRYVVQPGDTVWSIVSSLEPGQDPRPLVDELEARLPGGVLRPGSVLHLP